MEVGDFRLSTPKPRCGSLGLSLNSFWFMFRGLSPSMAGLFRPLQLSQRREAGPITLHLPHISVRDSVWTIPSSLAATKGIPCLVSFPPPTKMLPFGGFPLHKGVPILRLARSLIRVSSVLRLRALTRGGIAACRALLRLSSRAILQTAWHVSGQW